MQQFKLSTNKLHLLNQVKKNTLNIDEATIMYSFDVPFEITDEIINSVFKATKKRAVINGKTKGQATDEEVVQVFEKLMQDDVIKIIQNITLDFFLKDSSIKQVLDFKFVFTGHPEKSKNFQYSVEVEVWPNTNKIILDKIILEISKHKNRKSSLVEVVREVLCNYHLPIPKKYLNKKIDYELYNLKQNRKMENDHVGFNINSLNISEEEKKSVSDNLKIEIKLILFSIWLAKKNHIVIDPENFSLSELLEKNLCLD